METGLLVDSLTRRGTCQERHIKATSRYLPWTYTTPYGKTEDYLGITNQGRKQNPPCGTIWGILI